MRLALAEARGAAATADVPIGAVVLGPVSLLERDPPADARPAVLAGAHNVREARGDPTGHAEVVALRAAAARLGTWRLDG
ncbi:MAG TPA: hypothetical protein VNE21_09325, partial [Mycobacteriales bacterium]|nr:hypothetical protein [Mycobacteriales bacterium]